MKSRHCPALLSISDDRKKTSRASTSGICQIEIAWESLSSNCCSFLEGQIFGGIFAETLFSLARGIGANVFDSGIRGSAAKSTRKTQYLFFCFSVKHVSSHEI